MRGIYEFLADVSDIDIDDVDFIDEDATNIYRTAEFIVKQHLSYITDIDGRTRIMSEDTYYYRTEERDDVYDELFLTEGKRLHSSMHVRTYIE